MQIMLLCTKYSANYKKNPMYIPNNKTDLLHQNSMLLLVNKINYSRVNIKYISQELSPPEALKSVPI